MFTTCKAQVRDSVCMHNLGNEEWKAIRKIDTVDFYKYDVNKLRFKKWFHRDSLFIAKCNTTDCIYETAFAGEYVSKDSIRFIDFIIIKESFVEIRLGNFCDKIISRDYLPQINKLTFIMKNEYKLFDYVLIIQNDTGYVDFTITKPEFPPEVVKQIMKLKEDQKIMISDVRMLGPGGRRTLDFGATYTIKN